MELYFLIMFFILFVLIMLRKSIINPLFLTVSIWTIVPFLYVITPNGLYTLTDYFFVVVLLYIIAYISGYLFNSFAWVKSDRKLVEISKNKINSALLYFCLIVSLYLLMRYVLFMRTGINIYRISIESGLPRDIRILMYVEKLCLCLYFYVLLIKEKYSKVELFYLVIFALSYLLKFSKMNIMQLFIGTILVLMYKKKIKIRHVIILTSLVFVLVMSMNFIRSAQVEITGSIFSSVWKVLCIYFLSPLKAFDKILDNSVDFGTHNTFSFLYAIGSKVFRIPRPPASNFDGWVYVPVRTNVYTALAPFYADFGIVGVIIFGFVEGFFWRFIYVNRTKQNFNLFYFANIYILIFQFFSDILFTYFSTVLQMMIWCYCLTKLDIRKYKKLLIVN